MNKVIVLIISLSFLGYSEIVAENSNFSLANKTKGEVEQMLGSPDRKHTATEGRESWIYGNSVVFFINEKVSLWSDNGDMSDRETRKVSVSKDTNSFSSLIIQPGWKNDWSVDESFEAEDLVDLILKDSEINAGS